MWLHVAKSAIPFWYVPQDSFCPFLEHCQGVDFVVVPPALGPRDFFGSILLRTSEKRDVRIHGLVNGVRLTKPTMLKLMKSYKVPACAELRQRDSDGPPAPARWACCDGLAWLTPRLTSFGHGIPEGGLPEMCPKLAGSTLSKLRQRNSAPILSALLFCKSAAPPGASSDHEECLISDGASPVSPRKKGHRDV